MSVGYELDEAPTTMPLPVGISASMMARSVDPWIAGAAAFLLALGTVLVYSASAVRADATGAGGYSYLVQHLVSLTIGLGFIAVLVRIPLEAWSRLAYPLLVLSIVLLALVFVPGLGKRVNGAVRWLSLGPVRFQPGEFAKLAVIVYLAHSLAKKREKVGSFSIGFLPHVIVTTIPVLMLLAQPDLGTAAVIYAALGLMLFIAGTRIAYLVLVLACAIPVVAVYVHLKPHAMARLTVFLEPEAHKKTIGYQVYESLVAFGSGGPWGLGLGAGPQKRFFLPEAHTDFIAAVLGQELGFVGVCLVVVAFGVIVVRSLWIASRLPVRFPMFLAFGVGSWLGVQAFINLAVVMALLPTKGLTLPFISYGRSSLVISMIALGILLRATAEHRAQQPGGMLRTEARRRAARTAPRGVPVSAARGEAP